MGRLGVSRKRTRHPNDTRVSHPKLQPNGIYPAHVDAKGRVFNGKSNRPLRANPQDKTLNLTGPPSDKTLAIIQSGVILRPSQIHNVRQRIIGVVERHIERADRVLANEEKWTAPQVQLFLGLLHKVAPTMNATLHSIESRQRGAYESMTRQELEAQLHETLHGSVKVIDASVDEATEDRKPKSRAGKRIRLKPSERYKVRARILETKPETVLPPLTREQDDENRRRSAKAAAGVRKVAERREILETLRLMGQMDGVTEAQKTGGELAIPPAEEPE